MIARRRSTSRWTIALAIAGIAIAAVSSPVSAARQDVWKWQMPSELYKQLNHLQRANFDKAARLFSQGYQQTDRHRNSRDKIEEGVRLMKASALEWQKIRAQMGDTLDDASLAYVIFMEAHSHHFSRNRHKAIKTYTEVHDYFPDEIWIAVPALFFRAEAHFENGDDLAGFKSLDAIASDKGYLQHQLAAGALRRLADNHWANKEFDAAAKYWKLAWENFRKINRPEANNAVEKLKRHLIYQRKFDAVEALAFEEPRNNKTQTKADAIVGLIRWASSGWNNQWNDWYYNRFFAESQSRARIADDAAAFYEWAQSRQDFCQSEGRLWEYRTAMIGFAGRHKTASAEKLVDELLKTANEQKSDPALATERFNSLIGTTISIGRRDLTEACFPPISGIIRNANVTDIERQQLAEKLMHSLAYHGFKTEAQSLLPLYVDAAARFRAESFIAERTGNWPGVIAAQDKLERLKKPNLVREAREKRAWVYKERTREWDKAIKEFQLIADPPRTLWAISECQKASGDRKAAMTTLSEIAGAFPAEAPRAVFTKAEYHREAGEHKLAVALYRQILQRFKKSGQASLAHQRLEDYGIETGGGVITELD